MSRRTIIPAIASAMLTVAIAIPALAGPPTYSGTLTCVDPDDGEVLDLQSFDGDDKQLVNYWKRYWSNNTFCQKGSVSTSGITKD